MQKTRKLMTMGFCLSLCSAAGFGVCAADSPQGFAVCEDYLNVRSGPSREDDVIGKLYAGGEVLVLEENEDWLHIQSGNVNGYAAKEYIALGEEAEKIAASTGYTTATVGAYALNVRSDRSEDAEIIGTVYENLQYEVVDDQGDWIKLITADGTYGWVSSGYVSVRKEYAHAETLEEEQQRLDEHWLAYLAAQGQSLPESNAQTDEDTGWDDGASDGYDASGDDGASDGNGSSYDDGTSNGYDSSYDDGASNGYDASYDDGASDGNGSSYDDGTSDGYDSSYDDGASDGYAADTEDTYAAGSTSSSGSGSATGQSIAGYACQSAGNPYVWGGTSLTNGADCSGFVLSVFAQYGVSLPHSAAAQSGYGTPVSVSDLAPGDLVFYDYGSGISHVAIYIGSGSIIHASNESTGICYGSVGSPCACRRIV